MYYHMIAFLAGFLLDLLIGDPHWLYHPVRLIGNLIAALDHRLLDVTDIRNEKKERRAGILLVTVVLLATGAVSLCDCAGGRLYFRKYHDLSDPCDEMPES